VTEKKMSVREWIVAFDSGKFHDKDIDTQCSAGWYDWFCSEKSLRGRLYAMAPKVKRIAKSSKIDQDKMYVFFKNNCPCLGKLYDDFRFCDIVTRNVVFTITPKLGYDSEDFGKSQVYGLENVYESPLVLGTWKDVTTFFGV
jgi:hypothetical protein